MAKSTRSIARSDERETIFPAQVSVQGLSLTLLATLALIFILRYAADVFVPLVLGVLVSYALEPVVGTLARWRIPRPLAAAAVLVALLATLGVGVYGLTDDALEIVRTLPEAAQQLGRSVRRLRGSEGDNPIAEVERMATEVEKSAQAATAAPPADGVTRVQIEEKPLNVRGYLWTGSMGLLGLVSQAFLLVFLVYFLLSSGDLYKRKLVRIVGEPLSRKRVTMEVLDEIGTQIQRFLFVQVLTSAVVGVVSGAAFWAMGLQQAAVWGLLAGLFNSIPYFGPLIVMGGVGVVGYVQLGTLAKAVAIALVSFAITSLEGFLLTPWLVGRAARMNEVAVFVGLLFWAWMWGVIGLLLAVPMLVVVKSVCDRVEDLKPLGELLGD